MVKSWLISNSIQKRNSIILILIAVGGGILMWVNTPWGIGVGYDSVFYLSAADNFLNGYGLSRFDGYQNIIPLTHYPPLYPLLLSVVSFIAQIPTHLSARLISVSLFSINIYIISWLVYWFTKMGGISWLAAVTAAVSPLLIDVHLMAMSEPLFMVFMLLTILLLYKYGEKKELIYLVLAGLTSAMSCLTRYVGLALLATGGLLIFIWSHSSFWQRIKNVFLFGLLGTTPLVIWYIRNLHLAGTMSNRSILFHPPGVEKITGAISTISLWIFPGIASGRLRMIGLIIVTVIAIFLGVSWLLDLRKGITRISKDRSTLHLMSILCLFFVVYWAMLLVSLTFFDQSTRLNDRILSPTYVILLIMGFVVFSQRIMTKNHQILKLGFVFILVLWIGLNFYNSKQVYAVMRQEGKSFASKAWWSSETLGAVQSLRPESLIYSNEASLIYYWTRRSVNWIPEKWDPVRSEKVPDFDDKLAAMKTSISQNDGFLVIFDTIEDRWVYPTIEEMTSDFIIFGQYADGVIFTSP